jgi:PleD family two-component response regulator
MADGAMQEIKISVDHVDEMSVENNRNFEELKAEAEKFKIEKGTKKKSVIVVDNDNSALAMTKGMLENDYEVIAVTSGKEALRLFFQGVVPDLVLLDMKIDGWDTYSRIRGISNLHHAPIAIYTASKDDGDKARAQEMGAADFITKPIKKAELLDRVGRLIANS